MHKEEFIYYGKVIAQPRPRFTRAGKPYSTRKIVAYKQAIAAAYQRWCKGYKFAADVPLGMHIIIQRKLPKSKERKTIDVAAPDMGKPDLDNYAKAVMDALNGVAYKDDSQIVELRVEKKPRRKTYVDCDIMIVRITEMID